MSVLPLMLDALICKFQAEICNSAMSRSSIIALLIFGALLGYFLSFGPDTTRKVQAGGLSAFCAPFLSTAARDYKNRSHRCRPA